MKETRNPSKAFACCALIAAAALVTIAHQPPAARAADPPATPKPAIGSIKPDVAGVWVGRLMGRLRLVLHLDRDSTGAWKASVDSPDQNATGLKVDWVKVSEDSVSFTMKQIGGEFAGEIDPTRTAISGTWRQRGAVAPLVFEPQGSASVQMPNRPQEPKPPYPYDEIEVTYPNPNAKGVTLAGTLTVPKGKGPAPCAVLITGSGPEDRDESIFGHKPFWILADHLSRNGIAVLRSDDRGVGKSTGSAETATSEDFAGDVAGAVAFLKTRKEIDPKKIGLIGHSEGGLIAPMVAIRDKSVAFVVLLAGPGVPGDSVLITQARLISRTMGYNDSLVLRAQNTQRQLLRAAKESPDSASLAATLRGALQAQVDQLPEAQRASLGNLDEVVRGQTKMLLAPWMRFFLSYDPRPALTKVQCPVLAINGEKDIQVSAGQNLPEIRAALQKGGNKDATVESMPGLNHLFQTAETGGLTEYSTIQETFAPAALWKVSNWIGVKVGKVK